MERQRDREELLRSLSLFGDLDSAQLELAAHTFSEEWFTPGQRILRQGFTGTGFYVIAEGEAVVRLDGKDLTKLARGDFFGEISILLGSPPTADVTAVTPLLCLVLAGPATQDFLETHPRVMYRLLQAMAYRLKRTLEWQS